MDKLVLFIVTIGIFIEASELMLELKTPRGPPPGGCIDLRPYKRCMGYECGSGPAHMQRDCRRFCRNFRGKIIGDVDANDEQDCTANSRGPHAMVCLLEWWEEAGCTLNGTASPANNAEIVQRWHARRANGVKAKMAMYFRRANKGNVNYVIKCKGCRDLYSDCTNWARNNICGLNTSFMNLNCPRGCGHCQ